MLPLGRYICDLTEFEHAFVLDKRFEGSSKRKPLFAELLSAINYLGGKFSPDLVERVWVGGGFTTAKKEPTDIDVTFILNHDAYAGLSKNQRANLGKLLRADGFKGIGLSSVDGFMMVRERIALPWAGAGLGTGGAEYFPIRGAWDDWWSRDRASVPAGAAPVVADAEPVRGYVEVTI